MHTGNEPSDEDVDSVLCCFSQTQHKNPPTPGTFTGAACTTWRSNGPAPTRTTLARLSSSNGRHDDKGGPPEEHGSPAQDSEFTSAHWKQKAWLSCARFSPSSFDGAHSLTTLNRYHAFNKTASRAVSSFLPKRPSNLEVRMRRNVSRTGHDRCPHTRKGLTTTSQGRQRVQLSGRAQHPLGLAPAA